MEFLHCKFHDGNSSNRYEVSVKIADDGINISNQIFWKFSDIIILEKPIDNRPAILSNINISDARLYIHEEKFFHEIKKSIPKFRIDKKDSVDFLKESSALVIVVIALMILVPFIFNFISARISEQRLQEVGSDLTERLTNHHQITCKNAEGNSELQKLVNKISPNSNYKIYTIKETDLNAIALPGGTIIIFSALIEKLNSPNELVMILAHEVGHIKKEHHKKLLSTNLIISNMIGDYSKVIAYFLSLRYSRSDEIEADLFAYDFATKNAISPQSSIDVLNILKEQKIFGEKILSYLSTHPAIDERIAIVKEKMSNQKFISHDFVDQESWRKIKNICHDQK